MNGYMFKSNNKVFFQPVSFDDKTPFLKCFDKSSFGVYKNFNEDIYTVMDKVGDKLIVKRELQDSISDTVYYFRTTLKAYINIETGNSEFSPIGYGFYFKDSLYTYGNLFTMV